MTWKFEDCTILRKKKLDLWQPWKKLEQRCKAEFVLLFFSGDSCFVSWLKEELMCYWLHSEYAFNGFRHVFFRLLFHTKSVSAIMKSDQEMKISSKAKDLCLLSKQEHQQKQKVPNFSFIRELWKFLLLKRPEFSAFRSCPSPSTRSSMTDRLAELCYFLSFGLVQDLYK